MNLRPSLLVTLAAIALLAAAVLLPALLVEPKPPTHLPWQVRTTPRGGVEVFGVTVGESTLAEAERALGAGSEVTVFRSRDGAVAVEAFFESVNLHGLSGKIVVGLRIPAAESGPMYDRSVQVAKLGSSEFKVALAPADRGRAGSAVIDTLTYMPSINLDAELVAKRFGEPAEKWKERTTGVVHWLYPDVGLDVALSESEKEVLQYVRPAEFSRLRNPLTGAERLP